MNKNLIEVLEELKSKIGIEPIGISSKTFSKESNNISLSQNNTVIKLLLKILDKFDHLEEKVDKIDIKINKLGKLPIEPRKVENIIEILGPKVIFKNNGSSKKI